ncbi:MAG: hypothetical protein IPJ06_16065 [Saprospiraceae bacterium]|nr:hypothetical protein [Saprospiraceae bacterium]
MRHPMRWIAFWTYVIALFLPVFQGSDLKGYYLVLFGVIGLVDMQWVLGLPWLANLGFLLAFRMHGSRRRTIIVFVSLAMASLAWAIHSLPQEGTEELIGVAPDWGLRLWYFAFVLLAADALLGPRAGVRKRRKTNATSTVHMEDPELEEVDEH